jgi:hypothetical protein
MSALGRHALKHLNGFGLCRWLEYIVVCEIIREGNILTLQITEQRVMEKVWVLVHSVGQQQF